MCRGVYVYGPVPWEGERVHPFRVLLPRLEDGTLVLRDLVTHTFALDEYLAAFAAAARRCASGALKVAFSPGTPDA